MTWIDKIFGSIPVHKQLFVVFWSDAPGHIDRKIRGVPVTGATLHLKLHGGSSDSHYGVKVLDVKKLGKEECKELKITEGYQINGRYNNLKIKRIK